MLIKTTSIYDKTDKGREEIATRRYQLAPRLRTLLVLVDGRRDAEELLRNVAGLGLTGDSMQELLSQGYIVLSTSYDTVATPPVAVAAPLTPPTPVVQAAPAASAAARPAAPPVAPAKPETGTATMAAMMATKLTPTAQAALAAVPVVAPAPAPAAAAAPAPAGQQAAVAPTKAQQFQSLYDFYNKTIKSTIGLRGFTLQLKVEKASCVEDFRELRRPYLEAVLKAKGSELAAKLASQLDQLLGERSDDDLVHPRG